jgi:hypothetical protein
VGVETPTVLCSRLKTLNNATTTTPVGAFSLDVPRPHASLVELVTLTMYSFLRNLIQYSSIIIQG